MECCYQPNCEEYAVTPMLVAPAPPCAPKYCDEEPACMPCLPRCQKPVYYCCTKEPPPKRDYYCCTKVAPKRDCCPLPPQTVCCPVSPQTVCCRPRSTPPRHDSCGHGGHGGHGGHPPPQPQQQACNSCCAQPPPNKPVKTKYIIPCYRYEDGRIVNPLPSSALKRNGIQDHKYNECGSISYIRKCWHKAICSDYPIMIPVKLPKKCAAIK
ncbi:sperm mitochondrial-associated cysteine-rich protein-like isoform X4 [Spodoptera litura]|uniref:Sperm mitochondrial-associated cysteine-rich protein-like isoform X4 n=1 Tax=Spodoptera litura TaxID=69820 RepID=A0A9J7E4I6_SPOLT|nr:sperm mitochondrial-associated cysteine-rich protein-like isoform X4 [Spodoptera litura]